MSGGRASHPVVAAAALLLPRLVLLLCPGGSPGPVLLCLRCPLHVLLRPWCGAACEACSRSAATHSPSAANGRQGGWGAAQVLWQGCVPHPVLQLQHPRMRSNLLMLLARTHLAWLAGVCAVCSRLCTGLLMVTARCSCSAMALIGCSCRTSSPSCRDLDARPVSHTAQHNRVC